MCKNSFVFAPSFSTFCIQLTSRRDAWRLVSSHEKFLKEGTYIHTIAGQARNILGPYCLPSLSKSRQNTSPFSLARENCSGETWRSVSAINAAYFSENYVVHFPRHVRGFLPFACFKFLGITWSTRTWCRCWRRLMVIGGGLAKIIRRTVGAVSSVVPGFLEPGKSAMRRLRQNMTRQFWRSRYCLLIIPREFV